METNGSTDVTEALGVVKDWASGKIKMRLAQRKILDCHAFAKEIENKDLEIDLLKSQLASAYEKIKSLSMANDEKQKEKTS